MARRKSKRSLIYAISIGVHLAVGAALAFVPQEKLREVVAIALNETKQEKKAEPPKPPEHPPDRPTHGPGHNVHAAVAAAAMAPGAAQDAPAFTDIGLALDSSSSDGLAINMATPAAVAPPPPVPSKPKVLVARPTETQCTEEIVKARPLGVVRPMYTDQARRARIEGRVRIQLMVDEQGEVTDARLLQGLGYGLDEVAIEAARRLRFRPATQCRRVVAAPFVIAMRFQLGS